MRPSGREEPRPIEPAEPTGYEDEPREQFQPLSARNHCQLYHYERASHDLKNEAGYYQRMLTDKCHFVLELGCGTGCISEFLYSRGFKVFGVDLSDAMLRFSGVPRHVPVAQMDMRLLGFRQVFDAVIIAQNTLNLLQSKKTIARCLSEVRKVLKPEGLLLLHLHLVDEDFPAEETRQLQFSVFDHPEGGKIVKETIKTRVVEQSLLILEERYKIRRFDQAHPDINYSHTMSLAFFTKKTWLALLSGSGFTINSLQHGFTYSSKDEASSTLHIVAQSL